MKRTPFLLAAALLLVPPQARPQVPAEPAAAAESKPPDLRPPPPVLAAEPSLAPAAAPPAAAQVTSQAKPAHGLFPLWGDKVRAKGFDLPNPFGVMVNYYYQKSDITISNLKLGLNGGALQPVDFIKIPDARTKASALTVRPSLMVLPFFSVYAVFSSGATQTNVHVAEPVDFTTLAKSGAQVLSLGGTFQMGYKGFFGVADFNGSVSDVERLADAVGANMLSFRLGYNHRLNDDGRGIALWAGTAGQVIDVATEGTVRLAEVLPPPSGDRCSTLPPAQRTLCTALVQAISDPNATVTYSLDKKPLHVWNMILGTQFALDRFWHFRVETTFLGGRTSFLLGTEYRFDIL
ncbi:MAG TPA: hypothetical protein VLU43_00800 [Anaeromyxobacteraceae bacterium]|nr:hypothetical protein [Anaeromyxobacteraceae bacterium]